MFKQKKNSPFYFSRGERLGIISLLLAIIGLLCLVHWVPIPRSRTFQLSSDEMDRLQYQLDSLRCIALEEKEPKLYPFNPNFMTDYKAYTLGVTPDQYDRLRAYRESGQWINSSADFKKVTQVPDSVLQRISPYFKFPDWVTNPKKRSKPAFVKNKEFKGEKMDLNSATVEQLQEVSGIGKVLSQRIVDKRSQLGGFSHDLQLHTVWGLKPEVVKKALERFEVKTPKPIVKMNINSASASDLSTIPGISFDLGKKIWEFVYLREGISDFEELAKIEELSPQKLQLIQLYLLIE